MSLCCMRKSCMLLPVLNVRRSYTPAREECGCMMVHVQEADLALILLQHHDQRVCELIRLHMATQYRETDLSSDSVGSLLISVGNTQRSILQGTLIKGSLHRQFEWQCRLKIDQGIRSA